MSFRDTSSHQPQAVRVRRRERRNNEVDKVRQDTSLLMTPNPGGANLIRRRRRGFTLSKEVLFSLGVITTTLQGGGLIFGFSAFANQVTKLPGSPYTIDNVTSIFTIGHNITAWGCILSGILLDKLGPRACAVSGLLIEAVGHALMSQVVHVSQTTTYIAFGLLGLGGCQVLLAALTFTDAFENSGLTSAILTGGFQAGGLVFMVLPYVPDWEMFFKFYAVFCVCSAVLTAGVYPDSPLTSYQAAVEQSEIAQVSSAMANQRTLKQVLCRPGTIGFMLTFMVAGSALTYGTGEFIAALQNKDDCMWDATNETFKDCSKQSLQDSFNNVWIPLIGNFIIPISLALGKLIDATGFGLAGFINIFSVQAFVAALWLLPLEGQYLTLILYNVAMTAVFTVQNAYICTIGHAHIGSLFSISNAAMGFGNLLADWLTLNPFGDGDTAISTSILVSSITWLILCTPLYFWVIVEEKTRRQKRAGFDSFLQQASTFIAGNGNSMTSDRPASSYRSQGAHSKSTGGTAARRVDISEARSQTPLLTVQRAGNRQQTSNVVTSVLSAFGMNNGTQEGYGRRDVPAATFNPVLTVNPEAWELKVGNALTAGADKMFCVFDFDRTVTKCFMEDGARSLDCHDILASIPKISVECKTTMEEMMDHYYPIEIDPTMSREDKIPHMVEWYAKVNFLLGAQNLVHDDVVAAVAACHDFQIRQGVEEAFGICLEKGIPVIIVSAGLGNVIEEVVRQRIAKPGGVLGEAWPNVRVLSNTMVWDEEGKFSEFSEPLVHMYNKSLQDAPADILTMLEGRNVGVLCGDGLGDLTMAQGHEATDVLKFGFLNEKYEDRLPKYIGSQAFDRIILNDGDWATVLEFLQKL